MNTARLRQELGQNGNLTRTLENLDGKDRPHDEGHPFGKAQRAAIRQRCAGLERRLSALHAFLPLRGVWLSQLRATFGRRQFDDGILRSPERIGVELPYARNIRPGHGHSGLTIRQWSR